MSPEDCVTWNPLNDSFEAIMGKLGLNDKKPVPEPVALEEPDPLGLIMFGKPLESVNSTSTTGKASIGRSSAFVSFGTKCAIE